MPTQTQSYLELYRIALTKIARALTPWSANEDERKKARAMVEAYERARATVEAQQASYAASILPNQPGPFGTQILPEDG